MSYGLEFRDKALFEFREAYVWYENRKQGLGKDFRKEVSDKISKIVDNPYHYKRTYNNQYEALIARFPFLITYNVNESKKEIVIVAIFHTSRNPKGKYKS